MATRYSDSSASLHRVQGPAISDVLSRWLPSAAMIVVVAVLVIPPTAFLVYTSLITDDPSLPAQFTLSHFVKMVGDPRLYASLWNSLVFSALTAVLSILWGGILAWVVERTNVPFRFLSYLTVVMLLAMPHVLYVSAWQFLLGRQGPLNELYRVLTDSRDTFFNVYSMTGMVIVQTINWSPFTFMLLSATFRRSNAEMEEAARMCGASVVRTVTHISFRTAWPAIVGVAILAFIRNIESFDVPLLIGMPAGINLLTTDVYLSVSKSPPEMGHASAFSLLLIVVLGFLIYYYGKYAQSADRYASITGKAFRPRPFDLGRWRWLGGLITALNFVIVLLAPLAALVWNSLMPFVRPMRWSAVQLLTLDNYRAVLGNTHYLSLPLNTIGVSVVAATTTMVITTVAGWLVVRQARGGRIVEQLVTAPLVFPSIILGVALVIMGLHLPIPLYGTPAIIVLAFIIRFLPLGMRYTHDGVLQIHRELEEAAAASGASRWVVLRRIVVPLLLPALASGWMFIFLIGANELSMSILLAGPRSPMMAVAMYELWGNGQSVEVYALGLLWTIFMTGCAILFFFLARRAAGAIILK